MAQDTPNDWHTTRLKEKAMIDLRKFLRTNTVLIALCATTMLGAPTAQAAPTLTTESGRTSVKLDRGFLAALQSLSVRPGIIEPGRLVNRHGNTFAIFGITTGVVDLKPLKAEIAHEGGLTLTAGATRVELSSFLIDLTGSRPVLSGLVVVNDTLVGRLPLFDLNLGSAKIENLHDYLRVGDVGASLSAEAASALNSVFKINALKAGLPIGVAKVRTSLSDTH
jgi:hypothetical protein